MSLTEPGWADDPNRKGGDRAPRLRVPTDEAAESALLAALADGDDAVRSTAVETIRRAATGPESLTRRLVAGLYPRLEDEDEAVRRAAHGALVTIAIEQPRSIPDTGVTVSRLQSVRDRDIGVPEDRVQRAIARLTR